MQSKPLRERVVYVGLVKETMSISKCRIGRIITLRSKGEVKVGRLKDAIREAGLTAEQFLELLK